MNEEYNNKGIAFHKTSCKFIWLDWFLRRLRVRWVFYILQSMKTRCLSMPIPVPSEFLLFCQLWCHGRFFTFKWTQWVNNGSKSSSNDADRLYLPSSLIRWVKDCFRWWQEEKMMLQTDNSAAPLCCNTFTVCVAPRPEATVHFERPSRSIIISNKNSIAYVWIIYASKQVFPCSYCFQNPWTNNQD